MSRDAFGTELGRIHMQKQDLNSLQTRKMKGLKKRGGGKDSGSPKTKKAKTVIENESEET